MSLRNLLTVLALMIAAASTGTSVSKAVLLKVVAPPMAWSESRIGDKLDVALTRSGKLQVRQVTGLEEDLPAFPGSAFHLDSLVDWGLEAGGRYLVLVIIDREELQKRKGWHLPLIFHRWETVGVVEGEVRLVDLSRGRLVKAEPFSVEVKARGVFQAALDDDKNDPDLHMSPLQKVRFFSVLEDRLCDHLIQTLGQLSGAR